MPLLFATIVPQGASTVPWLMPTCATIENVDTTSMPEYILMLEYFVKMVKAQKKFER